MTEFGYGFSLSANRFRGDPYEFKTLVRRAGRAVTHRLHNQSNGATRRALRCEAGLHRGGPDGQAGCSRHVFGCARQEGVRGTAIAPPRIGPDRVRCHFNLYGSMELGSCAVSVMSPTSRSITTANCRVKPLTTRRRVARTWPSSSKARRKSQSLLFSSFLVSRRSPHPRKQNSLPSKPPGCAAGLELAGVWTVDE